MCINYHTVLAPRLNHLRVLGLALQQEAKVVAIHCYLAHLGIANADGLTAGLQTHTMAQKQSKASQSIRFRFFLFVDVISCCRCGGSWSTKSDCILQWLDVVRSHFGSRSGAVTVDWLQGWVKCCYHEARKRLYKRMKGKQQIDWTCTWGSRTDPPSFDLLATERDATCR